MVVVSKAKTSLIVSLLLQVNNPRQDSTSLGLEWQVEMILELEEKGNCFK